MHERFSQGEWWILNSAVEDKYPLAWLVDPELAMKYNRRTHGMDSLAVLDVLEHLFAEELLDAEARTNCDDGRSLGSLSREQIRQSLDEDAPGKLNYAHYGLTLNGGAAWEAFARPRWEDFLLEERDDEDSSIWHVTCADRRRLAYYRSALSTHEKNEAPVRAPIIEIGAWSPTYWKTLPNGFRVSYREIVETETPVFVEEEWMRRQLHVPRLVLDSAVLVSLGVTVAECQHEERCQPFSKSAPVLAAWSFSICSAGIRPSSESF